MSENMKEILKAQEELGQTFHAFKEKNDQALKELKDKGVTDSILNEHVDRINADISDLTERLDAAVAQASRPAAASDEERSIRNEAAQFMSSAMRREITADAVDVEEYNNYVSAFNNYLRRGDGANDIRNAMSVGSDPEGGYLAPTVVTQRIIERLHETSNLRSLAGQITIGGDALTFPLDLNKGVSGGWVNETQTRAETNTPEVGEGRIAVHEQYAQPKVTQKLLDDAIVDIEGWLVNKTADQMIRTENAAFIDGDGNGKPRGFLDYAAGATTTADKTRSWGKLQKFITGGAGIFKTDGTGADPLIDVIHSLKPEYRSGSVWVANRLTAAAMRKIKDGDGNYLWSMGDIRGNQPSTFLGYAVSEQEDMPDIADNAYALAFGNFGEGYLVVDRQGMRLLRDPYTAKPFVKFYMTRRVGGDVVNFDAIKLVQFAD